MKLYVFPGTPRHVNRAEVIDMIESGKITQNAAIYDEGAPPASVCAVKDHPDFKGTADFDAAVTKATTTPKPATTTTTTPPTTTTTPPTKKGSDFNPLPVIAGVIGLIFLVLVLSALFGGPKFGWGKGIEERIVALENRPANVADTAALEAAKKASEDANARAAAAEVKANAAVRQSGEMANANLCPGGNLDACVASLKSQGVAEKFGKEACAPTCVN